MAEIIPFPRRDRFVHHIDEGTFSSNHGIIGKAHKPKPKSKPAKRRKRRAEKLAK